MKPKLGSKGYELKNSTNKTLDICGSPKKRICQRNFCILLLFFFFGEELYSILGSLESRPMCKIMIISLKCLM